MTPRNNKKTGAASWFQCEKCSINIVNKDIEAHSTDCPTNSSTYNFIKDGTLHAKLDKKINMYDDKNETDSDSKVFLSESVIQLCSLATSEWAVIEFTDTTPPLAKMVWPTKETISSVVMTKNALDLCKKKTNTTVKVVKLQENIAIAHTVSVVLLNSPDKLNITSHLQKRLQRIFIDKVFCVGNRISLMYFGKMLTFDIKKIDSNNTLEESFERLNVDQVNFYKMSKTTSWIVSGKTSESATVSKPQQIGGLELEMKKIRRAIKFFLSRNHSYGVKINSSILLYGNPGTGKTLLANTLAKEFNCSIVNICASDLRCEYSENPEQTIKALFQNATERSPSIVILDKVHLLCPVRTSRMTDSETRIASGLRTALDDARGSQVFIIAITSKTESIDPDFRSGSFDMEIEIPTPNCKARRDILTKLFNSCGLSEQDLDEVALSTHGFVGADLVRLCSEAGLEAWEREAANIEFSDFKVALKYVRPSAMREVQVEVDNVKWSDIGGQEEIKLVLKQAVEWPLRHPESFIQLGITPPKGVLMFGPPGCSKTMIAKALATESGLNFLSIKGPELFSKWVGDSEKAVRDVFKKAREVAPSIIFFDEIDALGGERSSGSSGTNVQERVLTQLLTELDGVSPLGNVTVLAATNRPDRIDAALLRPGRLDTIVYVKLPNESTRREILKLKLSKMPTSEVNIEEIVQLTDKYSGAEVNNVCTKAAMIALEENLKEKVVKGSHFLKALEKIKPRTPEYLIEIYEKF